MDERLSKDITEKLALKDLQQVFQKDLTEKNFKFLGLGKLFLYYGVEVVRGDEFASRIAGRDNCYQLKRVGLKNSCLRDMPGNATHYFLGERQFNEELYLYHKENSFSNDMYPIVFLRENFAKQTPSSEGVPFDTGV